MLCRSDASPQPHAVSPLTRSQASRCCRACLALQISLSQRAQSSMHNVKDSTPLAWTLMPHSLLQVKCVLWRMQWLRPQVRGMLGKNTISTALLQYACVEAQGSSRPGGAECLGGNGHRGKKTRVRSQPTILEARSETWVVLAVR